MSVPKKKNSASSAAMGVDVNCVVSSTVLCCYKMQHFSELCMLSALPSLPVLYLTGYRTAEKRGTGEVVVRKTKNKKENCFRWLTVARSISTSTIPTSSRANLQP
jgi:hypothetical protein